jgi:hypothetical protein
MNTEQLLGEINVKLNQILGLMAINGVEDDGEKVKRLNRLGMNHATIAALTGMTANAVALRVSRMKKDRT